jgi:hypothetical protein
MAILIAIYIIEQFIPRNKIVGFSIFFWGEGYYFDKIKLIMLLNLQSNGCKKKTRAKLAGVKI